MHSRFSKLIKAPSGGTGSNKVDRQAVAEAAAAVLVKEGLMTQNPRAAVAGPKRIIR